MIQTFLHTLLNNLNIPLMDTKNISQLITTYIGTSKQIKCIELLCYTYFPKEQDLIEHCTNHDLVGWLHTQNYVLHPTITASKYYRYKDYFDYRTTDWNTTQFLLELNISPFMSRPPPIGRVDYFIDLGTYEVNELELYGSSNEEDKKRKAKLQKMQYRAQRQAQRQERRLRR